MSVQYDIQTQNYSVGATNMYLPGPGLKVVTPGRPVEEPRSQGGNVLFAVGTAGALGYCQSDDES